MIRLLLFFKKIQPLLLFLVIMAVCLSIFFGNNAYQRAKLMAVSHGVTVGIHDRMSAVSRYFSLEQQNRFLSDENARLHAELSRLSADTIRLVSHYPGRYYGSESLYYHVVRVVRNSYTQRNNFITISSGLNQGILPDMALFNSRGIVGYVKYCSDNFSIAVSVLNHRDFQTSGELLGQDGQGSIRWDGLNYQEVVMDEIPAHTPMVAGDTVVTTQFSNIFPEGLPIGTVVSYEVRENLLMRARLRLLADMSELNYLYAVLLDGQQERKYLEMLID